MITIKIKQMKYINTLVKDKDLPILFISDVINKLNFLIFIYN